MTTEFDPELGVLRIGHGELSVLARLAVAPTDPQLLDHATAPPLAALRAAGVVGPGGIHPDVRPLAEVVGAPAAVLDLHLREGAGPWRRCRGWATRTLLVVAVPTEDDADDLVADRPEAAASLLGELVGLTSAPAPGGPAVDVDTRRLDEMLVGGGTKGIAPTDAARARWRLRVRAAGDPADANAAGPGGPDALEVLDGGDGLWRLVEEAGRMRLLPADGVDVRRRIDEALRAVLG